MTAEPIQLCCLLWATPGEAAGLAAYEDAVLALVPERDRVVARTELFPVS